MNGFNVTGTLIWYYFICPRECWLMARNVVPDQDNTNVQIGKVIAENSYSREKKEIAVGHSKFDILHVDGDEMVIAEVKKSSRYRDSARMQLSFYLWELKQRGVVARGELRFPKEKEREEVVLTEDAEGELMTAIEKIKSIVTREKAPLPQKINFCKNCAYAEFCWC